MPGGEAVGACGNTKENRMSFLVIDPIPVTAFAARKRPGLYEAAGKRAIDVISVLLSAPIVLPVVLVIALIVRLEGGSGFYSHDRIGRAGRRFRCWKIRTMVPDAQARLDEHLARHPDAAREWSRHQKLSDDPRISRFGRFLRRASLDELPQLWNVLMGDMSLIGPRPFTPNQQQLYDAARRTDGYYRCRPGLSGLWQVESRNDGTFAERVALDDRYCARISLMGDLRIALRTVLVVMRCTGK